MWRVGRWGCAGGFNGPTPNIAASTAKKGLIRPRKQTPIVSFPVRNRCRTTSYSSLCLSIPLRLLRQSTTMSDWAKDEFMSNWDKTYVSTNLKDGSKAYNAALFKELRGQLANNEDLRRLSSEILVSLRGMTIGVW